MSNTSTMDQNTTSVPFMFYDCLKDFYFGLTASYIVITLCFFLGTPANSWQLWLLLHDGWKIKPTQVFLLNHIILELLFCIECAVDLLNMLIFDMSPIWYTMYFVFCLCWVGRSLMQVCIAVEQYLAVIHPIIFLKYKDIKYRIICIAVVWLVSVANGIYELYKEHYPDLIFNYVFPVEVSVILFCCVSVLRALKHPGPGDTQITMERGRDVGNQQKRNAFNTIFTGLLIILIAYLLPISMTLFTELIPDRKLYICEISPIMGTLNYLSVIIIPLMKMYKNCHIKCINRKKKIRENSSEDFAIRKIFFQWFHMKS